MQISSGRAGKSDRIATSRLVDVLRLYLDDVEGPVWMKELPSKFPYSTTEFVVGSDRGNGDIDQNAHIRIVIGTK